MLHLSFKIELKLDNSLFELSSIPLFINSKENLDLFYIFNDYYYTSNNF